MRTVTLAEAYAIQRIAKLRIFHERGTIDTGQAVTSMLHDLSLCESKFAAEQCVARFPDEFHGEIIRQIEHWMSKDHPGQLFVFAPTAHTDDELLELDSLVRLFGAAMLNYLENPTGIQDFQTDPLELPRSKWLAIQKFQTVDEQCCKRENCRNFRINHGVFCPEHHYEMLYGNPPPNSAT